MSLDYLKDFHLVGLIFVVLVIKFSILLWSVGVGYTYGKTMYYSTEDKNLSAQFGINDLKCYDHN